MNIDRCVCYNKTFKEIYDKSLKVGINNLEDLKDKMNICDKCQTCNPYIREMFNFKIFKFGKIIE